MKRSRKSRGEARPGGDVRLRVVSRKLERHVNDAGRIVIEEVDWKHCVTVGRIKDGKSVREVYQAGEEFEVDQPTAAQLLNSGDVEYAEGPRTVFRPPSIDHQQEYINGIRLKEEVLGKHSTRQAGQPDYDAPWENTEEEEDEIYE